MTIHWKAVEQYFTVVLFVNPLTPRVKPWVIQSFLTFDSMDKTLKCDHSLESCWAVLYCGAVCLTPRVKPWVIQSSLTFDSMDRTSECYHSLESCWAVLYCDGVCFSIVLSRVKELIGILACCTCPFLTQFNCQWYIHSGKHWKDHRFYLTVLLFYIQSCSGSTVNFVFKWTRSKRGQWKALVLKQLPNKCLNFSLNIWLSVKKM